MKMPSLRHICVGLPLIALLRAPVALGCDQAPTVKEATPDEIRAFFKAQQRTVLTFLGYSGAGYEDTGAMLAEAGRTLDRFDPKTTIVTIGATPDGIGAVYEIAKRRGFMTVGIVSTQAKDDDVTLSSCVDVVFYVADATWGGFLPGTEQLSPTSTAMVENSDAIVAIGGGEVARDELMAAQRLGRRTQFIPADMNHRAAQEKAAKKGQPIPTDFRGAAGAVFGAAALHPRGSATAQVGGDGQKGPATPQSLE